MPLCRVAWLITRHVPTGRPGSLQWYRATGGHAFWACTCNAKLCPISNRVCRKTSLFADGVLTKINDTADLRIIGSWMNGPGRSWKSKNNDDKEILILVRHTCSFSCFFSRKSAGHYECETITFLWYSALCDVLRNNNIMRVRAIPTCGVHLLYEV